jgi:MFS family permease
MNEPGPSGTASEAQISLAPNGDGAKSWPERRVGNAFVLCYALAYTGVWLALLTPMLVTIALRVRELAPASAAANLSLVLGVGAFFAVIGNPLFGRMSDLTTSRWGMRRPWLIGGMIVGTAAFVLMALAPSMFLVVVGWCIAQLAFNAVLAAAVAVLPDQVPVHQHGTVCGILGICMPIGQVGGTFLVKALPDSMLLRFIVPALIGSACVLVFALVLPDRRLHATSGRSSDSFGQFVRSFWLDPREYPNFFWAWLSRFLLVAGTAFLTTYQSLYLMDELGFAEEQVPTLIFKGMLVQAVAIVIASLAAGRVSDALGRRKIFVLTSAAVYSAGLWTIAAADAYSTYLIGMALTGIGQGVFFAVDLALIARILPNRELNAAKDLGMFNVANTLPQTLVPMLGASILWMGGNDYTWLFVVAGTVAFLSALAIAPLREVR